MRQHLRTGLPGRLLPLQYVQQHFLSLSAFPRLHSTGLRFITTVIAGPFCFHRAHLGLESHTASCVHRALTPTPVLAQGGPGHVMTRVPFKVGSAENIGSCCRGWRCSSSLGGFWPHDLPGVTCKHYGRHCSLFIQLAGQHPARPEALALGLCTSHL